MTISRGPLGARTLAAARTALAATLTSALLAILPAAAPAQGITTGAIAGIVTDQSGAPVAGVQIRIQNKATGYTAGGLTQENGRYRVQNLQVGGPYTVTARRIGLQPQERTDQYVALSQTLVLDFTLAQTAQQLAGVTVISTTAQDFSPANTGTKTAVSDTSIQRLPTLTRNLTDFIKLVPQVSQSGPGYSGGGMSNRMNNVQIDGSTERDVFGLGSTGQPGAEVNAKSVSIDAVKEFQVLLAPYDVRQGNFGGLLLNAVTKSGTNDWRGTAYYFYRNQNYGADTPVVRATPFNRKQFGFTLGGPIIRDKLHFFVAPEFQQENTPVTGPYLGQPTSTQTRFPIYPESLARFESIAAQLGASQLGSPGYANIPNPLSNIFGRVDYQINDIHRLVFHYNYSRGERLRQQNNRGSTLAVYSSNFHNFVNVKNAPVLQLFSNFKNGASNELFVGYNNWYNRRTPQSPLPQIRVNNVVGPNGNAAILAGADQFSQGNALDTKTFELTENYTFRPFGAHTITVGTRNEYVWLRNLFTQSSYGVWSFRNLDSLAARNANSFRKAIILRNGGNVEFTALQDAFYAQDQWQATPRLAITAGLRFDLSSFLDDVPYNAAIDSAYGRRTDDIPKHSLQFSPRLGFNWDITGDQVNQLRGGAGLFVGTPPYVWLENAYVNSGNIITFLNCNTSGSSAPAPAYQQDPSGITACRNGQGTRPIGDVNFLSSNLKFPQPLRGSLAYDRRLPWDLVATVEGLYSRTLNQLFFVSKNVAGPQGTSATGRVLYINTVNPANGSATLLPPPSVVANGGTARFSTAIDLQNQNKDYSYSVTGQLRKRYTTRWEGMVAYTYSRSRDVQSFSSSTHISNWQFGRTLAGRQEDAYTAVSLFDQPHKIVASATYTLTWLKRWSTDLSMFYQGVSGAPHDYIYGSSGGSSGDLNGDGSNANDLLYVPRNALDATEIQFRNVGTRTPAIQAQDFENFIKSSPCLSAHRGQILPRNTCRQPFTNQVDVAIRQNLPVVQGQRVAIQLDVFNFGNLLNKNWGQQRVSPLSGNSNIPLVTHVGYSSNDPRTAVPIVQFTPPNGGEYVVGNFVSNFWRTQISFRYSF
jgi:outer membrane receptor for ferrienterochelin and colicin